MLFAAMAEHDGLDAAAAALGVPRATLSRKLAALEERLGARLLQRTTRRVAPSDFGRRCLLHSRRVAEELRAAEATVAAGRAEPSGPVRLSAPVLAARTFLPPVLAELAADHPAVRLEVNATERRVDLVAEGFDLAVRAGPLPDSSPVARRLGCGHDGLYAAPSCLAGAPPLGAPEELTAHALVHAGPLEAPGLRPRWTLRRGTEERAIDVAPRIGVDDPVLGLWPARAGRGVARLPRPSSRGPRCSTARSSPCCRGGARAQSSSARCSPAAAAWCWRCSSRSTRSPRPPSRSGERSPPKGCEAGGTLAELKADHRLSP